MIQVVKIEDAVGYPLAHDITEIRPGEFKGPAFHRGHVLSNGDLDHLQRLGKDHLFIIKPEADELHEDEAAVAIANALCGEGVEWEGQPREGKIASLSMSFGPLDEFVKQIEATHRSVFYMPH